jgi:hypothetical protein
VRRLPRGVRLGEVVCGAGRHGPDALEARRDPPRLGGPLLIVAAIGRLDEPQMPGYALRERFDLAVDVVARHCHVLFLQRPVSTDRLA